MVSVYYFIQEIPNVGLNPIYNRVNYDFVITPNTLYALNFFASCKLV